MMNLSFDELRLITQIRNIIDYENKSKEDLIKGLSEKKTRNTKIRNTKTRNIKTRNTKIANTKIRKNKIPKNKTRNKC